MKLKIKNLHYQRNGVHGESFYHALISYTNEGERVNNMIVTFQTKEHDNIIIWQTCRAVNLDNIETSWRGDTIAAWLQEYYNKEMKVMGGTIYDFCTKKQIYSV